MALPNHPVIFFRDINSRKETTIFNTIEKLIITRPDQVIEFKDADKMSVISVVSAGQDNDVGEPIFSSTGIKSIFKQQVGAINEGITVTCMIPKPKYSDLIKLEKFSRQPNIETAFHKFGNLGFHFPEVPVYEKDPTDIIGFTLKPPIMEWGIPDVGADFVRATLNFSLGGADLK